MPPEVLPNYQVYLQISGTLHLLGSVPVPPIGTVVGVDKELTADYSNAWLEVIAHEWRVHDGLDKGHLPRVEITVRTKPAKA